MGLGPEIRDPEKNLFQIPDPGPVSKRHRIPDPDPQHLLSTIDCAGGGGEAAEGGGRGDGGVAEPRPPAGYGSTGSRACRHHPPHPQLSLLNQSTLLSLRGPTVPSRPEAVT
jgi:hypothetical protein